MNLETLRADPRYQHATSEFDNRLSNLHVADPAFGRRVTDLGRAVAEEIIPLAVEHGWDPDRQVWTD